MTKLGTTDSAICGGLPDVLDAVRACLENLDGLGSSERTALVFKHSRANLFARQGVRNENHSPLVACHEDATVGHLFDVEGKFFAKPVRYFVHLSSVPDSLS